MNVRTNEPSAAAAEGPAPLASIAGGDGSGRRWSRSADGRAQRRAALNLMEDALEARRALEKTNVDLRESERRFREVIDGLPAAVYTTDAEGRLTHFNPECVALSGRTPVLGSDQWCVSWKLFYPDGRPMPHEECPMAVALKEGRSVRGQEAIAERPDGTRVCFTPYPTPLKDAEGRVVGGINMLVDVTERNHAEALVLRQKEELQAQAGELADLHRRKDEFLAMLAHELRNPLAPIANAVHLLGLQRENETPTHQHARVIIERQVGQLRHLIDDLLEISRFASGKFLLSREWVTMAGIVAGAVETTRPLIDDRRHHFELTVPAEPIWLYADAARLEQVVTNLLSNAAKYTDPGGHLSLDVELEGDEAVLRVRDTGIGIDPKLLPRVFELFTQAERGLDRSMGGLGIGLSLVHRLVDLHGGKVQASSTPGQGSEFVVRLPAASRPSSERVPVAIANFPEKACRVLVVDDNVDSAVSLAVLLEMSKNEVRVVHDGSDALKAALDFLPNVVVLDLGLPTLNGFEVAQQIREQPGLRDTMLIALTGYGQETDRLRSQAAGFDHHLVKPADYEKIREILATVEPRAEG